MSTDIAQPPRFCPECGHKSGDGPCSTCKPYGRPCTWCLHSGPVPTDQEPPAVPPIDPDSMPSAEPPLTAAEYAIGDYVGETKIYGHTIHEHKNAWIVMRRKPNGTIISQRVLLKREGHTRSDAIALAGRQDAAER